MTKIKTILVDDEPRGLTSLQKLLQLNCDEVDIIACCDNAIEAKEKISSLKPGWGKSLPNFIYTKKLRSWAYPGIDRLD